MVIVLLSPLVYWLIKKSRFWFVAVIGIAWFFSTLFLSKDSAIEIYLNMLVTASFFFSVGAYYSINKENFVMRFREIKFVPYLYVFVAIADVLSKGIEYNIYIHKAGILLGIVAIVLIASELLENNKVKLNKTLVNSSFFIFALHYMIITNIGKLAFIMLHVPDNNPYAMLGLYLGTTIATIIICLGLYVLLKRLTPRLCNLITGGR